MVHRFVEDFLILFDKDHVGSLNWRKSAGFLHGIDGEPMHSDLLEGICCRCRCLRRAVRSQQRGSGLPAAFHLSASPCVVFSCKCGTPDHSHLNAGYAAASGTSPKHASAWATPSDAADNTRLTPAVLAASTVEGDTQLKTPPSLVGSKRGEWPCSWPQHQRRSRDVRLRLQYPRCPLRCAPTLLLKTNLSGPTPRIPACGAHHLRRGHSSCLQ
ncbi:hypothetical protein HPB52_002285 [Rhipicephalus sanguineus]|uniref:Uncharacterized protein n=1 Tax=Rhipicephalus sanguineus TaxID=34632 RepID=A0A9D4SVI3_RHISA|nr:hypothetical protein HPB52_002285 [Rhipicephalus sanguineus]